MSWDRVRLPDNKKPKSPPYLKWFFSLCVLFMLSIYLLYSNLSHDLPVFKQPDKVIIYSIPFVMAVVFFIINIVIYNKNNRYYLFLEKEKKNSDDKWHEWGDRSLHVLNSLVLLPDKITIPYMINHAKDHESSYKLTKDINYLPDNDSRVFYLLRHIKDNIEKIHSIVNINIIYATNRQKNESAIYLSDSWKKNFPMIRLPEYKIVDTLSYGELERIIVTNNDVVTIVIIEQAFRKGICSSVCSVLLFATDDIAKSNDLESEIYIKRSMVILPDENKEEAISLFADTQRHSKYAHYIITDGRVEKDIIQAVCSLENSTGFTLPENRVDLEYFIGPVGCFSSWITVALAIDLVLQNNRSVIMLANDNNTTTIGTIVAGINNEY